MNHIYRTVFNDRLGLVQVVAEHVRSRGKAASSAGALLLTMLAVAGADAAELPSGARVVHGSANLSRPSDQSMLIEQYSDKLITNWQNFDIGAGHSVTFSQPASSSVALNRVLGSDGSQIMGQLNANGQVFIVNPNGVLFGRDAQVSVGGLVASTLDISDSDFLGENYRFYGTEQTATVTNQGSITAAEGGAVALLGGQVSNQGVIVAQMGSVALAAGQAITLDFAGDGLLSVQIDEATHDALVENSQLIQADGGVVLLAADAADAVLETVVNNSGVIRARRLENRGGEIVLEGGSSGVVNVAGSLDASSEDGLGGQIQVTGETLLLTSATVDVSGYSGGGSIEIGGAYQGGDSLPHAQQLTVDAGSSLKADGLASGDGGSIVLWSDGQTQVQGSLQARGGASGGDGGLVETSGQELSLAGIAVDTSASVGTTGTWLLDPDGFTVGADGDLSGAQLTEALLSNNVEIKSSDGSGESGDISINDAVSWSQNSLTLNATRNINVANTLTISGSGSLVANYGSGVDADGVPYGFYTLQSATLGSFAGQVNISEEGEIWLGGEQYQVITDGADLAQLNGSSGNYVLGNDVTFYHDYIESFSGTLNGLGHDVGHYNGANYGGGKNGLFGNLESDARISNIAVWGPVTGDVGGNSFGSLANANYGEIINSINTGGNSVTNMYAYGGLVGINYGLIADSYSYVILTDESAVVLGGLVGINEEEGRIVRSSMRANSSSTAVGQSSSDAAYLGGLVGINRGSISKSYSEIAVDPTGDAENIVIGGGFVGLNDGTGTIDQSYALRAYSSLTVTGGGDKTGGFVGENKGSISNSYFYNQYSRINWVGGFAYINSGTISNSYAQDTNIRRNTQRYGFVAIDEGGAVTNSYYNHGYYNNVTPQVLDSSGAAEHSLTFSSTEDLAAAGFDTSIWGLGTDGGPILINIPVYVSNGKTVQYGSAVVGSLKVTGMQRKDTAATVFAQLSTDYLDVGNYAASSALSANSYSNIKGQFSISTKQLSLSGVVADKIYDGTTEASLNQEDELTDGGLVGLVDGQTLLVSYSDASFADKNAGNSKTVNLSYSLADGTGKASNYSLKGSSNGDGTGTTSTSAKISKLTLDADDLGAVAADKIYDGSALTSAELSTSNSVAQGDIESGSLVLEYSSASFEDENAGSDKDVTVSGLSLSGTDSKNYSLASDFSLQDQADISPRVISLSGSKLIDNNASADASQLLVQNLVAGDDLVLSGSVGLVSAEIGVQGISDVSTLSLSGADTANYSLVGSEGLVAVNDLNTESLDLDILVSGSASLSTSDSTVTVTQTSDKAILNWLRFSLAEGETLIFEQPSASSVVLNRVTGSDPSVIAGTLTANGRVFILNPHGVLFSASSQVNVAALVASTLALSDEDFLDDDLFLFVAGPSESGSLIAEGDIVIADGGFLALASGNGVELSGSLTAVDGDALLVAAKQLQLDSASSGLLDYGIADLSASTSLNSEPDLGTGLLETAGSSLALNVQPHVGSWSISLPELGVGTSYSADFIEQQLALQNLQLNALAGDLLVAEDLEWSSDQRLGLAASGEIVIEGRISASGEQSAISLEGDYRIDSARLDYSGNAVGYQNAGISLSGAEASLSIDGVDYRLLQDMDDVLAINDDAGSGHYALANSIDASGTTYTQALVNTLTGTLAGLGNVIDGLSIDTGTEDYANLIRSADGATIRDLGLENATVSGNGNVAPLLGGGDYITLDNVWTSGTATGFGADSTFVAGVANSLDYSEMTQVRSSVTVTADTGAVIEGGTQRSHDTGGLFANVRWSSVSDSYATGDVTGHTDVGGLVGDASGSDFNRVWASGNVSGTVGVTADGGVGTSASNLGGLIGYVSRGTITDARASGDVSGGSYFGGLIGRASLMEITRVSASGDVISNFTQAGHDGSTHIGGLIGQASEITLEDATASGDVITKDHDMDSSGHVGGLAGSAESSTISNSTATGTVYMNTGQKSFLLGGWNSSTTLINTYSTGSLVTFQNPTLAQQPSAITDTALQSAVDNVLRESQPQRASAASQTQPLTGYSNQLLDLLSNMQSDTGSSAASATSSGDYSANLQEIEVDGMTFQLTEDECEGPDCTVP